MKRKVLIIEDNEQNMYLLSYLFESYGYEVFRYDNGTDALSVVEECKPDLIILDIQLPDMDGYTIALRLRKIKSLDMVPVIAVSSYAMPGDKEKAYESGVTGYIEKPIDPDRFISQINDFIIKERD
jgi:two-component system, cell cycle response regulator DivK